MPATPKTLADVPDGPMLLVFKYLPFEDRISLAQTCRRLRHLAINEGALADEEHDLTTEESAHMALIHRARNLRVMSTEALEAFSSGYLELAEPQRWTIARLELCTDEDDTLLDVELAALLIAKLIIAAENANPEIALDPALVTGLTSCIELEIYSGTYTAFSESLPVAPEFFAALPNVRTLSWERPWLASAPNDTEPFDPILGSLESLTLDGHVYRDDAEEILSQLSDHVPSLSHLTFRAVNDTMVPPAVFDITTLESLEVEECPQFTQIPEDISSLTGLKRLRWVSGVELMPRSDGWKPMSRMSVPPRVVCSGV